MVFDFDHIANVLRTAAEATKTLMPIVRNFGIPSVVDKVASIATTAATVGENIIERINDGVIIANSQDKAHIEDALEHIQAVNNELNSYIEAH